LRLAEREKQPLYLKWSGEKSKKISSAKNGFSLFEGESPFEKARCLVLKFPLPGFLKSENTF